MVAPDGDDIGFEQVGGHAGAIAHIVAPTLSAITRVARVILGDARFDLADKIRAHVGRLGEDPAAQTRERSRFSEAPKARPTRPSITTRSEGLMPIGPTST